MKQFGFILNRFFKKLVMGFNAKNVVVNNNSVEEPKPAPLPVLNLKKDEVEHLLNLIRESHFKGEHVQKIFELVLKLQDYYIKLP
jgi:hypothetical protein